MGRTGGLLAAVVALVTLLAFRFPSQPEKAGAAAFADPFRYCQAVGTIDQPDNRYVGPKIPLAVAQGLRQAFGLPDTAPLEPFLRGTSWRCMQGEVYACNIGANLPCGEKADLSRVVTDGMKEFCRQNPDTEVIPAYVTGRATVYQWRCTRGNPQVVRQVATADARGFISTVWHRISPN